MIGKIKRPNGILHPNITDQDPLGPQAAHFDMHYGKNANIESLAALIYE